MIHIENLNFRFHGKEDKALTDVNLDIQPGSFVVITGPSGCGKSTLALAIGGYLFHQFDGEVSGSVTVNGLDVRHCPVYDVAEIVGLVQQNPEAQFCTLTVEDELAFGLENRCFSPDIIVKKMRDALKIVDGLHLMHRQLATLSGGEKQKIAVAAMMATEPEIIIFDEPTSNLDPSSTREIFDVIENIQSQRNVTVIVIEHKVGYLQRFNPRLIQMNAGRIIYDGKLYDWKPVWDFSSLVNKPYKTVQSNIPFVQVENLYAGFVKEQVLQGISLRVLPGEFISVMGDNGSGKTTFLRCILGLHKPQSGRVEVLGQDTASTPVSEIARDVGYVFQNPDHQMFTETVWDEATFAPRNFGIFNDKTILLLDDLIDRCGLSHYCGENPYRLSYGEKRRLNLISVLGYKPQLMLLDEILIGQDPGNAALLLDLLHQFVSDGGAVLMVNHTPEITRLIASRLVFFDHGQILIDAPIDKAFERLRLLGREAYVV